MKIGIVKEIYPGERRVGATPDTAKRLQKLGFEVVVQSGAGSAASYPDAAYAHVGCAIEASAEAVWSQADVVAKVRAPTDHPELGRHEGDLLREGGTVICFLWPAQNAELLQRLARRRINVIAMDAVPRISRAQKLDALSSMANIAGYRAVIEAANHFGRFFTGQITAAGKVPPAKVLVIGAGVAGLAAIGAARGLGAIVRAFDTRPAVKEQVQSMGAQFLELEFDANENGEGAGGYAKVMSPEFIAAEMELFRQQATEVDIIITTALIPGQRAPILIKREHVEGMRPGSVVVDLAAEQGGNCELTRANEVVDHGGVKILGFTDLPSRLAAQASQLYGTNIAHLLDDLGGASKFGFNLEDEVVRSALVIHDGEVIWPPPKKDPPKPVANAVQQAAVPGTAARSGATAARGRAMSLLLVGLVLVGIGVGAPPSFLAHFTVFVLAIFVGWQVIWNVSPALHTPLMSVTNAISGIIIIGGMLQVSGEPMSATVILGAAAILVATINIAGGFLVTQRMLQMFRR